MSARARAPSPSLEDRVRAGYLSNLALGAREDRRRIVAEAGLAVREGFFFDASRTAIHGDGNDPTGLEALRKEDEGWILAGGGGLADSTPINWDRLWRYLAHLWLREPVARNIVTAYTTLICGTGFSVKFAAKEDQRTFDEWAARKDVRFWRTCHNLVASMVLFGSMFSVRFPALKIPVERARDLRRALKLEALPNGTKAAKAWRTWEPDRFSDVVTAENDADTVIAWQLNSEKAIYYDARGVVQHDLVGAGKVTRGVPILMPAIADIVRLEKFTENRWWVNHTRARIPLTRTFQSAPQGSIATEAERWTTLPAPGSQVWDYAGGKWEFPSHNVGASDVKDDWRLLVLRIAAAVSLPEWMVLQDASNSNLASTLVAESPAHMMFGSLQAQVALQLDEVLEWFFPGKARSIEPAPIIPREIEKEGRFWLEAWRGGAISLETFHARVGLDPSEERGRLETDRTDGFIPLAPANPLLLAGRFGPGNGAGGDRDGVR